MRWKKNALHWTNSWNPTEEKSVSETGNIKAIKSKTQREKNVEGAHLTKEDLHVAKAYELLYIRHPQFRSDQISHSVVSNSLQPHESQHARPPCPSPTPEVHWDSHPSSQWRHPAISSSVIPFSSCPQSLPASESFPMSQLFAWGGQSTGVSALASFLPKKSQGWSPLEWTGWISLQTSSGKCKLKQWWDTTTC